MSTWTNEAILDALRGVVEPELGKDVVSLELVEVEGTSGDHGAGLTLTVKSSNPAMHARKRMQEAVEFALERAFGKPAKFSTIHIIFVMLVYDWDTFSNFHFFLIY